MKHEDAIKTMLAKSPRTKRTYERLLAWDETKTTEELASALHADANTVVQLAYKYGLERRKHGKRGRHIKDYSELIRRWDGNLSIKENAKALGISPFKAYLMRGRFDLPYLKVTKLGAYKIPSRSTPSDMVEKIEMLRRKGFSFTEIGRLYNITRERARQLCGVQNAETDR